ncbi:putative DNA-binding domain protein [Vibrio phage 1.215.B._10N.222.54.F7]|nr:putative DNA-binding domain protein [Vibrio phage 1.215.A._10N.222.54.F7]AUR96119.1 putative DNA-binding domain protein [Vibrio phage 1.215.B._10N.222.54.F7]
MSRKSRQLSTEQQQEQGDKKRGQSKAWYDENKESHNEKRRNRYETDPEYRARVQQQARESARKRRIENPSVTGIYHRELNGVQVRVFKASDVAEEAGISPRTIKADEKAGLIPLMSFEGKHRVYTENQKSGIIAFYAGDLSSAQLKASWNK